MDTCVTPSKGTVVGESGLAMYRIMQVEEIPLWVEASPWGLVGEDR